MKKKNDFRNLGLRRYSVLDKYKGRKDYGYRERMLLFYRSDNGSLSPFCKSMYE